MFRRASVSTVLWVLGVWLLVSMPFGMFVGLMCGFNGSDHEELPITPAPPADHKTFDTVRTAA
jgi:predicted transporter